MQARQSLKKRKKIICDVDKNFEWPKVTMNYCNRISNFEPDMMLKAKFGHFYSIWYSET